MLFAGRVAREKNLGLLLESFARAQEKVPEAWLLVAQPAMVGMWGEWRDCLLDQWEYTLRFVGIVESRAKRHELLVSLFASSVAYEAVTFPLVAGHHAF